MIRGRSSGQLRIIGGRWRGRRLKVLQHPHLRPTSDRMRETLFNWLAPAVHGQRWLDLFAGSGALGFEALSRGAAAGVFVEHDAAAAQQLREQAKILGAAVTVAQADACTWLCSAQAQEQGPFDLVFLDPPYAQPQLALRCCELLEAQGLLPLQALIYLECAGSTGSPVPIGWQIERESGGGRTRSTLYRTGMVE